MKNWKEELNGLFPLLGHRNWLVVADMAYPLQSQAGIKTLYAGEPYTDVLAHVYCEIEKAPHIRAKIYQDSELAFMTEEDVAGINVLQKQMEELLGGKAAAVLHETLIERLDEAAKMFNIVVIKTGMQIPYTTVFFELDCNYWNAKQEDVLRERMKTYRQKTKF
jgi:D-ribose pyranose/furanose isomerase RbsD